MMMSYFKIPYANAFQFQPPASSHFAAPITVRTEEESVCKRIAVTATLLLFDVWQSWLRKLSWTNLQP